MMPSVAIDRGVGPEPAQAREPAAGQMGHVEGDVAEQQTDEQQPVAAEQLVDHERPERQGDRRPARRRGRRPARPPCAARARCRDRAPAGRPRPGSPPARAGRKNPGPTRKITAHRTDSGAYSSDGPSTRAETTRNPYVVTPLMSSPRPTAIVPSGSGLARRPRFSASRTDTATDRRWPEPGGGWLTPGARRAASRAPCR